MLAPSQASVRVCVMCPSVCQANPGARIQQKRAGEGSFKAGLAAGHTETGRGVLRVIPCGHSLWPNSGTPQVLPAPPASPQAHTASRVLTSSLLPGSGLRSTQASLAPVPSSSVPISPASYRKRKGHPAPFPRAPP